MLEGLAAWVLNTYVGEYIENLNTDQLSIGLLQGEVELENLPLKKNAFKNLNLPIQVLSGYIGRIRLQIPFRRLHSEPWVISLEQLYIVVGPVSPDEFDDETRDNAHLENKLLLLDRLEQQWRTQFDSKEKPSYYSTSYSSWLSYGNSFISSIVNNIQLKIDDVHIRYEDKLTDPNHPFSFGIILNGLSAHSTDESWVPKFVIEDESNISRKLVELRDLAVYWDPDSELYGDLDRDDFFNEMERLSDTSIVNLHHYIMEPVSAEAKISQNCQPETLKSRHSARISCDLLLDKIPLTITNVQFDNLILWVKEFERLDKSYKHSKWRPQCSVKDNPREWWKYAILHHLDNIKKRNQSQTLTFIMQRSRDVVLYARSYRQYLAGNEPLNAQMKAHKTSVERNLSFEELQIIRQAVMDSYSRESFAEKATDVTGENNSKSLLQQWFPAWAGWYASTEVSQTENGNEDNSSGEKTELDKEILNVMTEPETEDSGTRKDFLSCSINFCLRQGTLILLCQDYNEPGPEPPPNNIPSKTKISVFELEFSNLVSKLQYRSKLSSTMLQLSLGGLYVKDKVTADTAFPLLISPQSSDSTHGGVEKKGQFGVSRDSYSKLFSMSSGFTSPQSDKSLFEVTYEVNPIDSTADYKLHISSRSLDIVYCPMAFKRLSAFFSSTNLLKNRRSELNLTSVAKMKYENLKKHTKDEIRNTFEQFIEGSARNIAKWDFLFDISAPQIIIPFDMTDKNANLVVFDFGKLFFTTASAQIKKKDVTLSPDSDDEDDFHTPCSTPPETAEHNMSVDDIQSYASPKSSIGEHSTLDCLAHEKMYDRYTLKLCDLQVLVGRTRDNWRYAHLRGTSPMHIIERFSICLQLERRVMYTTNPQWPAATLSGSLPKLVVHVNESKVQAFKTCIDILSNRNNYNSCDKSNVFNSHESFLSSSEPSTNTPTPTEEKCISDTHSNDEDAKLLMAQFCIDQLVLQIQSRGCSIAELQVTGVKSTLMKRPNDNSVNLTVHGFLLVDALQTYGSDFELLIASHKNVTMDSVSGSIRDESETTSPMSPASPCSHHLSVTSPQALTNALSNLQAGHKDDTFSNVASSPTSPPNQFKPMLNDPSFHDSEALISIEYTKVQNSSNPSSTDANSEAFQICSVLFNNLDIIANQETIVELLGFIKRVFPFEEATQEDFVSAQESLDNTYESSNTVDNAEIAVKTELSFDFHRLNVLLLRTISNDGAIIAQKVATATMSGAKIHATIVKGPETALTKERKWDLQEGCKVNSVDICFKCGQFIKVWEQEEGKDLVVEGALGGLQLINLTPDGTIHQRIISAGFDPLSNLSSHSHSGIYFAEESKSDNKFSTKALNFEINKPDISKKLIKDNHIDVKLRMASVCYVHSPEFLNALQSCASEFQQYIDRLKSSLKSAATEVAIGIVNKRADRISFYGSDSTFKERSMSFRSFEENKSDEIDGFFMLGDEADPNVCELRLDVDLQTPIIVFPKNVSSTQVLVGHLGRITINNTTRDSEFSTDKIDAFEGLSIGCEPFACDDIVNVKMSNMNVYSLNIADNTKCLSSLGQKPMSVGIDEIYNCSVNGHLILHDTVIDLKIGKDNDSNLVSTTKEQALMFMKKEDINLVEPSNNVVSSVLQVTGCVVSPLKVVLTKQQYLQIMESLDNVTYDEPQMDKSAETESSADNLTSEKDLKKNSSDEGFASSIMKIMAVRVLFSVPELNVELRGDLGDVMYESHGLVNIGFNDFFVHYQKDCPDLTSIQVSLKSLAMEDLFVDKESDHRYIMVSYSPPEEHLESEKRPSTSHLFYTQHSSYLSKSCPEVSEINQRKEFIHGSLPNNLDRKNMFQQNESNYRFKRVPCEFQTRKRHSFIPATPPVSPGLNSPPAESSTPSATLVHINTLLVDKNSVDFAKKYNSTNRFIDIDFNCLDTTINVQTWVMVLDFFGIGSEEITDELSKRTTEERKHYQTSGTLNSEGAVLKPKEVINSEIDLRICSLSLILNKPEYELTKANISNCVSHVTLRSGNFNIDGKLGSMSLLDLSPHSDLYTERFTTSGDQALDFKIFKYGSKDLNLKRDCDIKVKLRMSSVCYIHTQRFQAEMTAFFQHFTQLQLILNDLRAAAVGNLSQDALPRGSRIKLDIKANSPVIGIPMSSHSPEILVIDLGKLVVNNSFIFAGNPGSISVVNSHHPLSFSRANNDTIAPIMVQSIYGSLERDLRASDSGLNQISLIDDDHVCLLDSMNIELEEINLYSAIKKSGKINSNELNHNIGYQFSSFFIAKQGGPLLKKKFILKLQAERNLDGAISHSVPDLSVKGTISSVQLSLDIDQYKLIRGLLAHNLGESLEEFEIASNISPESVNKASPQDSPWVGMSLNIDLMNVTIELLKSHTAKRSSDSCLAQIDLIRSRLACQSYSDQSKEIDLVSQEILISDTRFRDSPANSRPNIYVNILQPMHSSKKAKKGILQAEVHYRMCNNNACFTVLVNNMRIMGIFDWLIAMNEFMMNNPENPHLKQDVIKSPPSSLPTSPRRRRGPAKMEPTLEFKLNIMDTELVVVEDTSSWDTNAVILKSTAVVTYKMEMCARPLSCSLQRLEVFSCTLGLEEETALSIIDPVTINVELHSEIPTNDSVIPKQVLEVTMQNLNVRLSYYDMQMFCRIFDSVPKQVTLKRNYCANLPANIQIAVEKLKTLGFDDDDCMKAVEVCDGSLDEAAIWLTQNATPMTPMTSNQIFKMSNNKFSISEIELRVALVCLCLIDDCKDADVPLIELSLSDMCFNMNIEQSPQIGTLDFILGCDYYNRQCSAWEPCIEPWACKINYFHDTSKIRLKLKADDILNVNITSSLLELSQSVHNIWTEDYYSSFKSTESSSGKYVDGISKAGFVRKRSPFVPYALKNETGSQLKFTTHTTNPTRIIEENSEFVEQSWTDVQPGQEVPFFFESRTKMRHLNTHELKIHQIVVQIAGWKSVMPVSVDKVGTYFRYMKHETQVCIEMFDHIDNIFIYIAFKP
ncbi:Vacuolar protein sorting-associated protein 13D [Nymphon striatum]|nr:Vacuolar protein sorting-associated protein 13D [Nymphon striatum]